MAFEIRKGGFDLTTRKGGPVKDRDYLRWIHNIGCVITGQCAVEAAHISFARPELGHFGRGKGQKVGDMWVLPISPNLHMQQHAAGDERKWWEGKGLDPHLICLVFYARYHEIGGEDAARECESLIRAGLGRNNGERK